MIVLSSICIRACLWCDQGNGDDTGSAAQGTADGLKQLVHSARGVAATVSAGSSISPNDVLNAVDDILDKSANLVAAAKTAVEDPENPNSKAQLTQVVIVFCCISFILYVSEHQSSVCMRACGSCNHGNCEDSES